MVKKTRTKSREQAAPSLSSAPTAAGGLRELHVRGYRSLRSLRVPLGRITVIVGANGTGKTNLYSALKLVQHAARGTLGSAIVDEGGLASMLWAGERERNEESRVTVRVTFDDLLYEMAIGYVPLNPAIPSVFDGDPDFKFERIAPAEEPLLTLLERNGTSAWGRDSDGQRVTWPFQLWAGESVLAQIREPQRFPLGAEMAMRFAQLRFYHQFAVERASPIRSPQVAVRTGLLSDDGRDLAAAIATIDEVGDSDALHAAVDAAFPGAKLSIDAERGTLQFKLAMPGVRRPMAARELSDGTLRFLCLAAALTAPRPPLFLALNEPESSLHPDVLPALAERIAACAATTQILVTTHSTTLADAVAARAGIAPIRLERVRGETRIAESETE